MNSLQSPATDLLLQDIRQLIEATRLAVAATVNSNLTTLYWQIGKRINHEVLNEERAPYGEQIVVTVARQLAMEYSQGFSEKSLRRMMQFADLFPDEQKVAPLLRHLSWTHFLALLPKMDTKIQIRKTLIHKLTIERAKIVGAVRNCNHSVI